jgi:hypothetical protein
MIFVDGGIATAFEEIVVKDRLLRSYRGKRA